MLWLLLIQMISLIYLTHKINYEAEAGVNSINNEYMRLKINFIIH